MSHYTPAPVAAALAAHAPSRIRALLDPAVGEGALVEALADRLSAKATAVCLDRDPLAVRAAEQRLLQVLAAERVNVFRADFLRWSKRTDAKFDCIVMNPPFAGRRADEVEVDLVAEGAATLPGRRFVPVEVLFLLRAVQLLTSRGRILAVVSSSVVAAAKTAWLRKWLFTMGAVTYVHELAPYSFPTVGGRTYLLVFDRGVTASRVVVANHNLTRPDLLSVAVRTISSEARLDYRHVATRVELARVRRRWAGLRWVKLGSVASVHRGSQPSGLQTRRGLHTVDFEGGYWRLSKKRRGEVDLSNEDRAVRKGDLLIARVGRDCGTTLGPFVGRQGTVCSDCVLVIRPKKKSQTFRLLFALVAALQSAQGAALLERGTGASYITAEALLAAGIPFELADRLKGEFSEFRRRVRARRSYASIGVSLRKLMNSPIPRRSLDGAS